MIKLHLKLTWPALILLLIALAIWLARDPASHATGARKPAPARRRPASQSRRPFVIEQDGPASSYDDETERLDRQAAEAAQAIFEESDRHNQTIIEELNKRNDQRKNRVHTHR